MKFQIMLPTYNRGDLVGGAIKTVLAQENPNWSLLVVDNNSADNTAEVVKSFDDPRIRYVCNPTNTSMSGNWEFGLKHLEEADAYTVLGDDDGFLPNALTVVENMFQEHDIEAVRVDDGCFTYPAVDGSTLSRLQASCRGEYSIYNSFEVLKKVARFEHPGGYKWLPSIYNSFFSRKLLETIKEKSPERVFGSAAPDIYTAMLAGGLGVNFLYLSYPVKLPGTSPKSNGFLVGKTGKKGKIDPRASEFYKSTIAEKLIRHDAITIFPHVWDSIQKVRSLLNIRDISLDSERVYTAVVKEFLKRSNVLLEGDIQFLSEVCSVPVEDVRKDISGRLKRKEVKERKRKIRKALTLSSLRRRIWPRSEPISSNKYFIDEYVADESVNDIYSGCMYYYQMLQPLDFEVKPVEDVAGIYASE
ncbi:protein of unknown function [Pseudodesulfovibrio profundus]|uniref:Glycosyltransferase 2-like domain-containing protein n=2 Tax=Pseudodesulfovibrio profundus TaxID=57320 RepID=A0A2C8F888_9BACT|nr:protein of unknown function [Pseudodesulfovibrio profundus]